MSAPQAWSDNDIYRCMKRHGLTFVQYDEMTIECMTGAGAAAAMIELRADMISKFNAALDKLNGDIKTLRAEKAELHFRIEHLEGERAEWGRVENDDEAQARTDYADPLN